MKNKEFEKRFEMECVIGNYNAGRRQYAKLVTRGYLAWFVIGLLTLSVVTFMLCITTGMAYQVLAVIGIVSAIAALVWAVFTLTSYE